MKSPSEPVNLKIEIEQLARQKWLDDGQQSEKNEIYWFEAEKEILSRFKTLKNHEIFFKKEN
jgi:hypothetical protein